MKPVERWIATIDACLIGYPRGNVPCQIAHPGPRWRVLRPTIILLEGGNPRDLAELAALTLTSTMVETIQRHYGGRYRITVCAVRPGRLGLTVWTI